MIQLPIKEQQISTLLFKDLQKTKPTCPEEELMEIEDFGLTENSSDDLIDEEGNYLFHLMDTSSYSNEKTESEKQEASVKIAEELQTRSSIIETKPAQDSSNQSNSQDCPSTKSHKITKRQHLTRSRMRKNEKSKLQKLSKDSYFTKNFLQFGKNPHFEWLELWMGAQYVQSHPTFSQIKNKGGINMSDFVQLYCQEKLQDVWREFFSKGILYRKLMISRVDDKNKLIFARYMPRFQEAFETKIFDHIA